MTSTSTPVTIGMIGAGLMADMHATSAGGVADVRVPYVHAADADQLSRFAASHDMEPLADLDALLDRNDVDAVLIATPTDTHVQLARRAIAAGKHVFVEKPVARTVADAEQLRHDARAANLTVATGHVIRYFPEYRALYDAVQRGDIGTPAVATFGRRCQQPDWSPEHWHTDMSRSGGVALDMLVHDVDLVRWMFGEPSDVHARVVGSDAHAGLDYALATLTVPDGPICHLHGSWCEPEGFSQSAEICGSLGMLSYDSRGRDELDVRRHAGSSAATALPPSPPGPDDPFGRQLRDFAHAIRTGTPVPGDIEWAIGSLRVAEAMLEASATRQTVRLSSRPTEVVS